MGKKLGSQNKTYDGFGWMQNDTTRVKQARAGEGAAGLESASLPQKARSGGTTTLEATKTDQKKTIRWKGHSRGDKDTKTPQQMAKIEA